MADGFPGSPNYSAMGLGLRVPSAPEQGDPATRMGLGSLQATRADDLVGLGGYVPGQYAMESAQRIEAPQVRAYFNQATNEMFAGDRAFDATDVRAALETAQAPTTRAPEGAGWVPLPDSSYRDYLQSLSERRGTGELLKLGARQVAEGVVGGAGALAEMAGSDTVGPALRGFAQEAFGQTTNEQLRSQLVAENSTLFERIVDAAIQSGPSLAAVLASGGAVGLGLRAAGAGAGAITAGSTAGAAGVSFPMHVQSFYEAALRNNYDVSDPAVKGQVLAGAVTNTMLDSIMPMMAAKALSRPVREAAEAAGQQVARGALNNALRGTARGGFAEGITEAAQSFLEMTVFDPQVRSMMTADDWKALGPYIARTYGEDLLVSFGAGALLGGGVGGATNFRATGQLSPTDVENLGDVAGAQAEAKEADGTPAIAGLLPAPRPKPLVLTPEQRVDTNVLQLTPEMRQRDAEAEAGRPAPMILRPSERVGPRPRLLAPSEMVTPEAAPTAPAAPAAPLALTSAQRRDPVAVQTTNRVEGNQQFTDITLNTGETFAAPGRLNPLQVQRAVVEYNAQRAATQGVTRVGRPSFAVSGEGQVTRIRLSDGETITLPGRVTEEALVNAAVRQYNDRLAPRPVEEVVTEAPPAPVVTPPAPEPGAPPIEDVVTPPAPTERNGLTKAARKAAAAEKAAREAAAAAAAAPQPSAEGVATEDLTLFRATVPGKPDAPDGFMYLASNEKAAQGGAGAPVRQVTTRFDNLLRVDSRPELDTILDLRNPDDVKRANEARAAGYDGVAIMRNAKSKAPWTEYFVLYPDRVMDTTPPPTTTPPAGKTTVQKKGTTKPRAPKKETLTRAGGRPRAEATGAETGGREAQRARTALALLDEVEGGTRARTARLPPEEVAARREAERAAQTAAEAREVVTREQAVARAEAEKRRFAGEMSEAQLINDELDGYIDDLGDASTSGDADARDQALFGIATVAYSKTPRGLKESNPELARAYRERLRRAKEFLATLPKEDQTYAKELYDKYKDVGSVPERQAAADSLSGMTGSASPIASLELMLDEFEAAKRAGTDLPPGFMQAFREAAIEVKALGEEGRAALRGNAPLLAYVNNQNEPNVQRGMLAARGGFALADWNTLTGAADLDGRPVAPIAPGRVQLLVRNFLTKLARRPAVTIVRSQADLKARFPQLYAAAVAARPQGDFDSAQAMGYSFGDGQVIIFTDRIATEQQLNFVLAHETIGHFGLRGIMPGPKFDALMEGLYARVPSVQTAVDAAISARPDLSRAEAVEEYLSDYAAILETNVVARVWSAIKGTLNKLGIRFGDEAVRYLLDQSRRYVRYGSGVTFDAEFVASRLHSVESMGDTGRFSVGPKLRDVNIMAGGLVDKIGGLPMSFEEGWTYLRGAGVNSTEAWDKFKATFLSLANFRSRQNAGLFALEKLLDETRNTSMAIKVEFNESLALVLNRAIAGEVGGISDKQTARINEMLYAAQRYNVAQVRKLGDLGNVPLFRMEGDELVPNTPEIRRLKALGTRTLVDMRDGFEYEVTYEEAGKTITKMEKFAGIEGLTEDSIEWRGYEKVRAAMDEIELRLLKARYQGVLDERALAFRQMAATVPDGELTADERAALTELSKLYGDLYTSNVQEDESGRAKLDPDYQVYANDILRTANAALIGKAEDRFEVLRKLLVEPRQFMKGESTTDLRRELPAALDAQVADDLVARLQGFKARAAEKLRQNNGFLVQNKVKQIILAELANRDADKFTKRTIATGYTPVLREGAYQIRVETTVGGKVVKLQDSYREQLVYSQFDTAAQAMEMATKTNELFKGNKFEAMYYDSAKGEYVLGEVELRAVSESALDAVAAPPQLNLNEFIRGLRQFDINLSPDKMEDVIVALTRQNSAARNRLERVFTPGAKDDGIMATMRHIESRASTIAKTLVRPRLAELMDRSMESSMKLWNGDPEHLRGLKERADKAAADPTLSREAKVDAQREYELYAYMYNQTNPGGGKPSRANQFYNEAARTVAFLDGNQNVDESDFGAGPMVSRIRAATSMMQLGASVATGALNILSVYTNGVPYLSSYNAKTGFGGGFSVGRVIAELHRAAAHVGGPGIISGQMNTAEFYTKVSRDPALQKRHRLEAHEAAFIAQEILDGAMIPAQSNALVGTARGRVTKGFQQQFLDKWMWTFNVTEQASRRTYGLTAYRLEYARQLAAGRDPEAAAEKAREFAVQALQFTMGEYSVLNRPPAWRSGIQSFMYMYKVFPTTSVQMFANMSRGGKVGMLVGLWLLTGLTGLPFAEDLEDLVDTLAQRLKVSGWQGARYEAAQFIDGIFPGMSPVFLKGIVNEVIPADVASRTSLGDLLPATDILLAGSDVARGISEIAGPAPSMLLGTARFAADAIAAPFSATTTLETVAREAPITMVRALADAYAYTQSGAVVDRRGYVVTPDMTAGTIIARALGFYPEAAARQYEIIRSAKRMTDYQREVVTGYRTAWVSAMMRGDREFARQIEDSVKEWNAASKGTALEIRNFVPNSQRALREARRPASERTLRSAANTAEQDLQRLVDLMTSN